MYKVFTYGTLMQGQRNHYLIEECDYLGDAVLDGYGLYESGYNYPGAVMMPGHQVYGEVYEVDQRIKDDLDILEAVGVIYDCKTVTVVMDGHEEKVLFYEYLRDTAGKEFCELSGKWGEGNVSEDEFSYGAVVYRYCDDHPEYLLIEDRNGNISFPKGHQNEGEKEMDCAIRKVFEETGLHIAPDGYFQYKISYPLGNDFSKYVTYYLADFNGQEPFINDGETKRIMILPYRQAYEKLTFDQHRDVLKEANKYLTKGMKVCCMFREEATFDPKNLERVKVYGSTCNGHNLFTWDMGERILLKCRKCGAYVLEQYSEIHMPDSTYVDYFPVRDEVHAEELNEKYDGWSIETDYPYKKIFFTYNYD